MVGIVSYGFYVPRYRLSVKDITCQWGKCSDKVEKSLRIRQKAVASADEDVVTMAYEAASRACAHAHSKIPDSIGAVFVGSETFPYAVKPSSTILAHWLGIEGNYLAYDTQFACKAATGALLSAQALVKSGDIDYALVVASDKANARPNDVLEYSAGSGANAWIVGRDHVGLELVNWASYSSDTPDFWRRAGAAYPSHAGRFTGTPAYFRHVAAASKALLEKTGIVAKDITYAVFHMPNGAFPQKVGASLGFSKEQLANGYVVPELGNSYSASALMGLAATIEHLQPGDTVFFCSYGSGAGADAILFRATEHILAMKQQFREHIAKTVSIDYGRYMEFMHITAPRT